MNVDTHSGIREMMFFPGSQLDCRVSVLLEEFLHLEFAVTPSPEDALVSDVKGCLILQLLLVLSSK